MVRIVDNQTWIKRLTRKTICFSKLEVMHDTVIGLLINKVVVGVIFMPNNRFHPLPDIGVPDDYALAQTELAGL